MEDGEGCNVSYVTVIPQPSVTGIHRICKYVVPFLSVTGGVGWGGGGHWIVTGRRKCRGGGRSGGLPSPPPKKANDDRNLGQR